jgi:hypothetical protein
MAIQYLQGTTFAPFDYASLPYSSGEVLLSGERWWQVDYNHESTSNAPPHSDYVRWSGEYEIGSGEFYAFNRIIDANQGTNQQVYEFAQFRLRSGEDINDDVLLHNYGWVSGEIAKELLNFVGTTLVTQPGVYIDDYNSNFVNAMEFYDITAGTGASYGLDNEDVPNTSTKRTFPFTAAGTITFSQNLVDDTDGQFWMYFLNAGGNEYNTENAIIVNDANDLPISGEINSTSRNFDFNYTTNVQGGRTPDTDADIVIVAIGKESAEYVLVENLIISEATGLSFIVTAPDERNYSNP